MDDLIAFLNARLDDDTRLALAARDPWFGYEPDDHVERVKWADALFIAQHSPNRVLAEVDAKRGVVKAYERAVAEFQDSGPAMISYDRLTGSVSSLRTALESLALPYADHPNYDTSWRP